MNTHLAGIPVMIAESNSSKTCSGVVKNLNSTSIHL